MRKPRALRARRPGRHRCTCQPIRSRRIRCRARGASRARFRACVRRERLRSAFLPRRHRRIPRRGVCRAPGRTRRSRALSPPAAATAASSCCRCSIPACSAVRQRLHRLQRQHVPAHLAQPGLRHRGIPRAHGRGPVRQRREWLRPRHVHTVPLPRRTAGAIAHPASKSSSRVRRAASWSAAR